MAEKLNIFVIVDKTEPTNTSVYKVGEEFQKCWRNFLQTAKAELVLPTYFKIELAQTGNKLLIRISE